MTQTAPRFPYPFTEQDSLDALAEWGANCGPNALAFALQIPLSEVRNAIPDFESRRYTSPTMMRAALRNLGIAFSDIRCRHEYDSKMFHRQIALVRIQWTGPWTQPGANPRWAYRHTHWIATWMQDGCNVLFDCNGGFQAFNEWRFDIVPALTNYDRADGDWYPTHIWRLADKATEQ